VNAAASVSATASHAVVLLFANQTVTIGDGAPTDTQPVIRVTLDKVDGRWLVSHFDPV
jgi:Mce-associated membrane protein